MCLILNFCAMKWVVMDSNHRRHRQQIYSLPHLATLVTTRCSFKAGAKVRNFFELATFLGIYFSKNSLFFQIKLFYHLSIESMHLEKPIFVGCERWFVAAFGECDGAKVAHSSAVFCLFQFPQMCVSIYKYVVGEGRAVLLIVHMTVSKEHSPAVINYEGVVGHDGKLQQHLVHLSVAITANGNDLVLHCVQSLNNALGVDALGYAVARTVVEDVAKDAEHVAMLVGVETEHLLKRGQASVNI